MSNSNLDQFIAYLQQQVDNHSIYVWGGQGEKSPKISEAWIRSMETSATNANRAIAFWKRQVASGYGEALRAFDCSGLGVYWLYNLKRLYAYDVNADTMMRRCDKLQRGELRRGDWVFRVESSGRAYHIGYIVDDALRVIEAKGRDDGVVKRSLTASGSSYWNRFGRPLVFREDILSEQDQPSSGGELPEKAAAEMPLLRRGSRGETVRRLQTLLIAAGFDCGVHGVDGIFGGNTLAAVRAYQSANRLSVDGIVGPKTWASLL